VEADQQQAEQGPEHDRDAGPQEVEPEEHGDAAEHDVEDVHRRGEPQRELVADLAVALRGGDVVDRADLDVHEILARLRLRVCHQPIPVPRR